MGLLNMNGTAAIFASDQRFALTVIAPALVCLQGLTIAAALSLGWYWVFAPWVVIIAATAFLVPRVGVFLLVASAYAVVSIPGLPGVYAADLIAFWVMGGVMVGQLASGRRLFVSTPLNRPILLVLTIFALSLANVHELRPGVVNWLRHVQLLTLCLAIATVVERRDIKHLLNFMLVLTFIFSVVNIASFLATGGTVRVFGPAHAFFAAFLSMAILHSFVYVLLASKPISRLRWAAVAAVYIGAQIATQTRASWLQVATATAVLAVILWRWAGRRHRPEIRRRMLLASVAMVLVAAIFLSGAIPFLAQPAGRIHRMLAGNSFTIHTRLFLWKIGFQAFLDSPLLGTGLGQVQRWDEFVPSWRFDPIAQHTRGLGAHNDSVTYLSETGILGILAVLWFLWQVVRMGRGPLNRASEPEEAARVLVLWIPAIAIVLRFFFGTHTFYSIAGILTALYFGLLAKSCITAPDADRDTTGGGVRRLISAG